MSRAARFCCIVLSFVSLAACAEPPSKEMNQAKGAVDAARAAGAEQYAAAEFGTAVDALRRSEEAVTQRDYRLALSLAIDSREQAQQAAKIAGENRAKARGDAERVVAEANVLLAQARERLDEPELARLPARVLAGPRRALDAASQTMQDARAALDGHDYSRAIALTDGLSVRIQEALAELDKARETPAPRRPR